MAAAALLGALLLLGPARRANAHARVFVGGAIGFPVYPYPYPYYYPYPVPYPESRRPDGRRAVGVALRPMGRPYRVWVPPHLR